MKDHGITSAAPNRPAIGRIVHCANYGGPYPGSFVPMLAAAAGAAREAGYETTVCLSKERAPGQPWLEDIRSCADIRFIKPSGLGADIQAVSAILGETSTPTVIHTHFGNYDVAAAVLRRMRRHTAVLWHLHSDRNRPMRLRSRAYGAVLGRFVDGILCVSPQIRDTALAQWVPASKLIDFPNAIDLRRFGPITVRERRASRAALGLSEDARVIVHFAWSWSLKGGDRMLASAARLPAERNVVFVTVIGETGDAPAELLRRTANVLPLEPRGNVNELYAAADVFLNTSRTEGMPFAVLEALARGLRVVAVDLPVSRALLQGLPGARVVSPDPRAISSALLELLDLSSSARFDHALAARARVKESYGLDSWSRRLVAIYADVLGQQPRDSAVTQTA